MVGMEEVFYDHLDSGETPGTCHDVQGMELITFSAVLVTPCSLFLLAVVQPAYHTISIVKEAVPNPPGGGQNSGL